MQIGELITGGQCGAGAREKRISKLLHLRQSLETGCTNIGLVSLATPPSTLLFCISDQALLCARRFLHVRTPSIMQRASYDS